MKTLAFFVGALLQSHQACAAPRDSAPLSIPIRDIIENRLSDYENHPGFKIYSRWLETPQGSQIRRNAGDVAAEYPDLSIDCHREHVSGCHFTSSIPFSDLTNALEETDILPSTLSRRKGKFKIKGGSKKPKGKSRGQRKETPDLSDFAEKATDLLVATNLTLPSISASGIAADDISITWNFKCEVLYFSSSKYAIKSHQVSKHEDNDISTTLVASVIGDTSQNGVEISQDFHCENEKDRCCFSQQSVKHTSGSGKTPTTLPSQPAKGCNEDSSGKVLDKYKCPEDEDGNPTLVPGWCGVHVTQYQKNMEDGPGDTSQYRFDVQLYDSKKSLIGFGNVLQVADTKEVGVPSGLPYVFTVGTENNKPYPIDSDAVLMSYNGQQWGSNDQKHFCNFGSYNDGKREGDCGFDCFNITTSLGNEKL